MAVFAAGCVAPAVKTREPANLTPHKQEVRAYVDSGQYLRDIAAVAARGKTWVEQRAAQRRNGERLAIVFDLDETLLYNWPHIIAHDFGYVPDVWGAWVAEARAPAIEPVRDLYKTARTLGVEVFFITGRPEKQRRATEKNLRVIDCAEYVALFCKPDGTTGSSAAFKTATRRNATNEGWTIIANVGDQESDLVGGFAEKTFKLPNPIYRVE